MSFFGIPMRNGLSLGLGTVASLTNGPGFLPDELFYGGTVQGAWYDPSDLTTLFQDSAGTTPVTAVEQPVGLMLDKSKGLVLGPELVTNGDFSSGTTGWTGIAVGGGTAVLAVVSGELSLSNGSTNDGVRATQSITTVIGRWYKATCSARRGSGAASAILRATNDSQGATPSLSENTTTSLSNVQLTITFLATATTTYITLGAASGGVSPPISYFDNISVKEIAGNHAYQSINTSRPTLRARYNLLTYSEQFDNAAWVKTNVTITANAAISPDGTTTADKLIEDNTSNRHFTYQQPTLTSSAYSYTVYAKAAERSWLVIDFTPGANTYCWFNLSNGTLGTVDASRTASISDVGNGWYRCTVTAASISGGVFTGTFVSTGNNVVTYTGDGTSGIFIWGAQLVPTAVFPSNTYQRIGAATDYATGAAFPPYLFFDGTDDSMLTNSVDFSGTDKMLVVAGVTKNNDTVSVFCELSADINSNTGSFINVSGTNNVTGFEFTSRGTGLTSLGTTGRFAITAPVTAVVSSIGNISAPLASIRVNAVTGTNGVSSQGTGNYGNYPLFIGSRNQASLRFNGNIYSLVIAGQSYSSGQISSTESWVAAKTPLGTI